MSRNKKHPFLGNNVHIPPNFSENSTLQVVYINFIDILIQSFAFRFYKIYTAFTTPVYNWQFLNYSVPQGC